MINPQKIVTMTKLALYDKHEGSADRAASEYFRHDYIYKKNLGTRLAVGIGGILILAIYWLRVVVIEEADILELNWQVYLIQSILFLVALLVIYSLFGTIQGTREYFLVQKRLERYNLLVKRLERLEQRQGAHRKEPEHSHGTNINHT